MKKILSILLILLFISAPCFGREAIFKLKWQNGVPYFKKTPVELLNGGYSAFECSPKHNGADKVTIWVKASDEEIEELKSWIEFIRYYNEEE